MVGARCIRNVIGVGALLALGWLPARALAFGAEGHHVVGAIAEGLIAGSNAAARVRVILGEESLADAGAWADCTRGVDPGPGFAYSAAGRFAECARFETAEGIAAMTDFVRRNDGRCARQAADEACHRRFHYSDVAVQRGRYATDAAGARSDDIVGALTATIRVLRGEPAPAPFDIRGPREALRLLTHYVGDIHQPLHVGAVYLDAAGERVDPDATGLDPATSTRGGT